MQDFEIGSILVCKEDSDSYIIWKDYYAIVLKSIDPMYSFHIECVNIITKNTGKSEYANYFINDNFRLMSKAERVLYVK